MSSTPITGRISIREKIGYSLGDAASHIVFDSSVAILAYFYTDIYGLPPAVMGTMFLLVRILDAITDPLMGAIADVTHTRWGRFRPYILATCIPFALSCILVYTIPDFDDSGKVVYAVAAYIFMVLMYTAVNIPYCSLGATLTVDPQEILSLQSWRFAIAPIGGALGSAFILPCADLLYPGDRASGIQAAMTIFGCLGCIMFLICFLTTKERIQPVQEEKMDVIRDLKLLFSNDQWRIQSLCGFLMLIAVTLRGGILVYYVNNVLKLSADMLSLFMLGGTGAAMLGSVLAKPLGSRFCKVDVFFWVNTLAAALCVLCFFLPVHLWFLPLAFHLFIATIQGGNSVFRWSMIVDTNNYGEWKTKRRITGINIAANVFIIKLGVAIGGAILGWLLAYFGYLVNTSEQSADVTRGIALLFSVIPAFFYMAAALSIKLYKLNSSKMAEIIDDLNRSNTHEIN